MQSDIKSAVSAYVQRNYPATLQHPNLGQYLADIQAYCSMPNREPGKKINLWPCRDEGTFVTAIDKYFSIETPGPRQRYFIK
jgi:hypothetical protein